VVHTTEADPSALPPDEVKGAVALLDESLSRLESLDSSCDLQTQKRAGDGNQTRVLSWGGPSGRQLPEWR
jgi:hypothetical protein